MKSGQLFAHWKQVQPELIWTIEQFGDEELSHVPVENSWPVGEIMLHIAAAEEGRFRYVVKRELSDWPDYELDNMACIGA